MALTALKKRPGKMPAAALLTIGNELLTGRTVNTNAAFLGAELTRLGFRVKEQKACPDDISAIQNSLKQLAAADLVIVTGGLGPTPDDLTREAIAAFFSVPLRFSAGQFQAMIAIYRKLGREIPELARREAYYPANAKPLLNRFGIALGFWVFNQKQILVVLPGVPTELQKMFTHDVKPLLKKYFKKLSADQTLVVRMAGISEPRIIEKLGVDFFKTAFQFGIYPSEAETQICIRSPSKKTISFLKRKIHRRLKPWIFSWGEESLPQIIGKLLLKRNKTLSVAESCTGGGLAYELTRYAGASRFFSGGAIVYNVAAKSQLGVSPVTIKKHGEVSEQVAAELAVKACHFWKTSFGIGVTGIAGPSGGSVRKPVGFVYIAIFGEKKIIVERHLFWGNREQIQRKAVSKSLEMLWRRLILR